MHCILKPKKYLNCESIGWLHIVVISRTSKTCITIRILFEMYGLFGTTMVMKHLLSYMLLEVGTLKIVFFLGGLLRYKLYIRDLQFHLKPLLGMYCSGHSVQGPSLTQDISKFQTSYILNI